MLYQKMCFVVYLTDKHQTSSTSLKLHHFYKPFLVHLFHSTIGYVRMKTKALHMRVLLIFYRDISFSYRCLTLYRYYREWYNVAPP